MGFKEGFLWGTSISAAQAEGGWDEDGKAPTQVDFANVGSAQSNGRQLIYKKNDGTKGQLSGAYALFPQGIEGGINQDGVEFYRQVFLELKKYHIDPIITLYKYDEPIYFEQTYGGQIER